MMAFDTLHVHLHAKPLPRRKLQVLAALLDFGACANAALDGKTCCQKVYERSRQLLHNAGLSPLIDEYMSRLQELERRRPLPGGDHRRFDDVRMYREAVARLSLQTIAAMVLGPECSENGDLLNQDDGELETLFRIVMQCQIIDDVLDYSQDAAAGLPGFLTASASLLQSIELTAQATRNYGTGVDLQKFGAMFPLQLALYCVSAIAKMAVRICYWNSRFFGKHSTSAAQCSACRSNTSVSPDSSCQYDTHWYRQ